MRRDQGWQEHSGCLADYPHIGRSGRDPSGMSEHEPHWLTGVAKTALGVARAR